MLERDPGRRHPLRLLLPAAERVAAEATELGGAAPTELEPLLHGHRFATEGVWRVRWSGASAVVKVLSDREATRRPPPHFRWWRREAIVLQGGLPPAYAEAGIRTPRLLRLVERSPHELALWLEDVTAPHGFSWGPEQYVESARRLGRAQAAPPAVPEKWWSTRFLADYVAEWDAHVDWSVLDRADLWAAPLIRAAWGPDFRPRLRRFHQLRPRLLSILDALPRVFCHLDFWPANLFSGPGELVAVDWAFAGEGAPGEDVGNLLPDTAFDLVLPARTLAQLVEPVFDAYAESCPGDRRLVRLGMLASAVKYVWLPVGMLAQARAREHAAYGGNLPADSETLYRERGLALEMLFDWAEAAVRLADELAIA